MELTFICNTNHPIPEINYAVFSNWYGEFNIDRDTTWYSYDEEKGIMTMTWHNVYIWNGIEANYDLPEDFFKEAVLENIEVEDDAPGDYMFECLECYADEEPLDVKKKFCVTLIRYGCVGVMACDEEEALYIADHQRPGTINWNDDFLADSAEQDAYFNGECVTRPVFFKKRKEQ